MAGNPSRAEPATQAKDSLSRGVGWSVAFILLALAAVQVSHAQTIERYEGILIDNQRLNCKKAVVATNCSVNTWALDQEAFC